MNQDLYQAERVPSKKSFRYILGFFCLLLIFTPFLYQPLSTKHIQVVKNKISKNLPIKKSNDLVQPAISSLLWGTNIDLLTNNNSFVTSPDISTKLSSIPIKFIRIPLRTNISSLSNASTEATFLQAVSQAKKMGATLDVSIHTIDPTSQYDATALMDDITALNDIASIYTSGTVYIDYGNEDDSALLYNWDAKTYTTNWNTYIPYLKSHITNPNTFLFGGPVSFELDPDYISYFAQNASPLPDYLVWHMYSCPSSMVISNCLAQVATWNDMMKTLKNNLAEIHDQQIPLIVDEWNYDSGAQANDGKCNNKDFINSWTSEMFSLFQSFHIFASAQAMGTDMCPLLDTKNNLTFQGIALQNLYRKYNIK